ncbi:MAG: helix-turn-helix transcriptional regulator [Alphaproteobacteria bacterium]|jgi:DNA-binding HxlR family transcriptional regulator|nr:helix-turn-helix transcriptional regulator [Alphaproteobacteria bacterium]
MENNDNKAECCYVSKTISLIGGKWKPVVLWYLYQNKVLRYSDLQKFIPSITPKMLSQVLKDLISDGLASKKIYTQIPPKVEYSLTPSGESLMPILDEMYKWGEKNKTIICKSKLEAQETQQ